MWCAYWSPIVLLHGESLHRNWWPVAYVSTIRYRDSAAIRRPMHNRKMQIMIPNLLVHRRLAIDAVAIRYIVRMWQMNIWQWKLRGNLIRISNRNWINLNWLTWMCWHLCSWPPNGINPECWRIRWHQVVLRFLFHCPIGFLNIFCNWIEPILHHLCDLNIARILLVLKRKKILNKLNNDAILCHHTHRWIALLTFSEHHP